MRQEATFALSGEGKEMWAGSHALVKVGLRPVLNFCFSGIHARTWPRVSFDIRNGRKTWADKYMERRGSSELCPGMLNPLDVQTSLLLPSAAH